MFKSLYAKIIGNNMVSKHLFRPGSGSSDAVWYTEVDPKKIEYISLIPPATSFLIGKSAYNGIWDGRWDSLKKPFCEHIIYRTAAEVINHIPYKKTTIFKSATTGRMSKNESISTYKKLTRLHDILMREGYRSQYQLQNLEKMRYVGHICIPKHEIVLGMDRNDKLIRLIGGKHRLAIAQHIGIKRIPAILSIVHKNAADMIPESSRLITGNTEDFRPF